MKRDAISYYPVFLNVAGKKCVVVGGGQVALRKVKGLLDAGAEVRVISPALCPGTDQTGRNGKDRVGNEAIPAW